MIFKIINLTIIFYIIILSLLLNNSLENKTINTLKEIKTIEKYNKLCERGGFLSNNNNIFKKSSLPKISIISPVYNREHYIIRFIRSIQNQFLDDIEIIFIDDFSSDNSAKIIEDCQKEDERIILIKHKQNKGTLISRNDGVYHSRGEYLIFPDSDDILSNDILKYCYYKATTENYDLIRFNLYDGNKEGIINYLKMIKNQKILQPELSSHIFYGNGHLEQTDYSISNKFIKRDIYIKALNSISNYYLIQNMIVYEDGLINFKLYKFAKSLFHTKKIGYYYIQNNLSITKNFKKDIERTIKNCFLYLKFIFEYTKNNKYEKSMASCIYHNVLLEISDIKYFLKLTKDFKFYYRIINLYIKCEFIPILDKMELKNITNIIKIAEASYLNFTYFLDNN